MQDGRAGTGHLSWVWWHMPRFRQPRACVTNPATRHALLAQPLRHRNRIGGPVLPNRDDGQPDARPL
jgi:hypothetical protein